MSAGASPGVQGIADEWPANNRNVSTAAILSSVDVFILIRSFVTQGDITRKNQDDAVVSQFELS